MRAVVYTRFGPPEVLELRDVAKPTPKDNEVLIGIRATTVTSGDVRLRSFDVPLMYRLPVGVMSGFRKPRRPILGNALAGVIESVGKDVKLFREGDRVFGSSGFRTGTYAEGICLPEDGALAMMPARLTFEEAAAVPFGALASLHFLRKARVESGQKVLIYGASGSVGTAAVQLARAFGAEVIGVCGGAHLDLVRSLGAERVLDYTKEDFTSSGETYDVIYDTVGKSPFPGSLASLNEKGVYLLGAVWKMSWYARALWTSMTSGKKVIAGMAGESRADMDFLKGLIETEKLRAVIDRRYPLERAAEAHRYVERGHKAGSVVLTCRPEEIPQGR